MNLNQIRQTLGDLSGRNDLAEENTDLADFFINEGSRYLDRNSEVQKSLASYFTYLSAGGWNVQVPSSRAIREVWIASTTARYRLEKISLQDMLQLCYPSLVSLTTTGTPYYYCPAVTRAVPEGGTLPTDIGNYVDVISTTGQSYNAVFIAPAADTQLLVEVVGLYYAKQLTLDADENFWSAVHPSLLVQAALREIEVFNRNSTGVKDWESAIASNLDGINKDLIEEHIADIDQIEG